MKAAVLVVVLALGSSAPIAAQAPAIPPGTRVRVETQQKTRIDGTLMSQSSDSITVAPPGALRTVVASGDIRRIFVSGGRSHVHGAARGVKVGALVGAGTMLVFGVAYIGNSIDDNIGPLLLAPILGAGLGAVYGGLIGVLFGAERWSRVYSAPIRLSVMPDQNGAPGIGVSIRF